MNGMTRQEAGMEHTRAVMWLMEFTSFLLKQRELMAEPIKSKGMSICSEDS